SYDVISYALYPDVYKDYQKFHEKFADVSVLDTLTFFYGMRLGEEIEVEIEEGKTLFIKLVSISERSEEHTSELQSRFDLVCRRLLPLYSFPTRRSSDLKL